MEHFLALDASPFFFFQMREEIGGQLVKLDNW